jgi:hypothetical protein
LNFGGLGHVGNDADGRTFGLGIQLVDQLVDACFVGGDIVYADEVALAGEATGDSLTSKRENLSVCATS